MFAYRKTGYRAPAKNEIGWLFRDAPICCVHSPAGCECYGIGVSHDVHQAEVFQCFPTDYGLLGLFNNSKAILILLRIRS